MADEIVILDGAQYLTMHIMVMKEQRLEQNCSRNLPQTRPSS